MKNIHIFYHIWQINNWKDIFEEQMRAIEDSGIVEAAKTITITVCGKEDLPNLPEKSEVIRFEHNSNLKDIFKLIMQTAEKNPNSYICFFHSKGITHCGLPAIHWRQYLTYWTITRWKTNVELLAEADCVGTNWNVDNRFGRYPHFSGTFWWARGSFILGLDASYVDSDDRMLKEFWIGSSIMKKGAVVAEIHCSEMNDGFNARHYWEDYPAHLYHGAENAKIFRYSPMQSNT